MPSAQVELVLLETRVTQCRRRVLIHPGAEPILLKPQLSMEETSFFFTVAYAAADLYEAPDVSAC